MKFRIFFGSVAVFLITALPALAATFTVTKVADTNDGTCDADCSFREAVAAAVANPGDDIIGFQGPGDALGVPQTIVLSLGEIVISGKGALTINGPGPSLLTIDGAATSRILTIDRATVNITGITFTGGNGAGALNTGRGGAIYNAGGTTVISNSRIVGNTAANGGGFNNASTGSPAVPGDLTLINCIVGNNTATGSGGGIQNFSTSTITIDRSLFIGNVSNGTTGGGGGQFNGRVNITNSTFTGNSAPSGSGGGFQSNGSLGTTITNVTISGNSSLNNGGGIHRGTTNVNFWIRNSIVAGNSGTMTSPDITNSTGGIVSEGSNIIGVTGTSTGWVASDQLDTDPLLGMLADNGGPTQTFLPMAGSPAIDGGDDCVLDLSCATNNPPSAIVTDQRGFSRPSGSAVDIGAVEVIQPATVSGRVVVPGGSLNQRVFLSIGTGMGVVQTTQANPYGYFVFRGIEPGQMYTIQAVSKETPFDPVMLDVNGDVSGIQITVAAPMFKGVFDQKK